MTDLIAAFEALFGPQSWGDRVWDGGPTFDEPDLYVSESDARHMQQAYDNWLMRESA